MSAFNIISFNYVCPGCGASACIEAQCHIASSFEGDERGRFCHRTYGLAEEMAWWPSTHPKWATWHAANNSKTNSNKEEADECCYASCKNCGANLFAIISFKALCPDFVVQVGLEESWPIEWDR